MSASKLNEEFELAGGSYSVSNIEEYFQYMLKNYGEKINE